jgi:hypothetical protein
MSVLWILLLNADRLSPDCNFRFLNSCSALLLSAKPVALPDRVWLYSTLKHRDDIIILNRSHPIFTILILDNTVAPFGQRINYIFDHGWLAVDPAFELYLCKLIFCCCLSLGIFLSLMAWAYSISQNASWLVRIEPLTILEGSNSSLHWFRLIASYRLRNHCD